MVHEIIGKERAKVLELRTKMGLHRLETDKSRWERWELTAAKLMALDSVAAAILQAEADSPPQTVNLTGKKPSVPISVLVAERDFLLSLASDDTQRGMFESGGSRRSKASLLSRLIDQFSGNAEEQPLTSEKKPLEPGPCLEVQAASLAAIPDSFYASQTVEMLRYYSEKFLNELESRGCGDSWKLVHNGVGEGDDSVPYRVDD